MRIASIEIKNFRCLRHVEIDFDQVTTFVGPNGAGKSSVLRALSWFFNGDRLDDEDVYAGAADDDRRIQVRVTFNQITAEDRAQLTDKYAPSGTDTFTAWKTWDAGEEKITGKALAFAPFETVRATSGATDKKAALKKVADDFPDLDIPKPGTLAAMSDAMDSWERAHPEHLEESRVSDTHFFGFHGQGKLSGIFDYVLVTADLRASEESVDGRNTIIGRILERAIDREAANTAFQALVEELARRQDEIHETYLNEQLTDLAKALTTEVGAFAKGRGVQLRATASDLKAAPARVAVSILDELVETPVDRQGHGFQRTLLISALKLLATRGAKSSDKSVICLAIEEPELFQHPTQARTFSTVLRDLAQQTDSGLQVAYATHSPYFIEPRYFDQVRRVTRSKASEDDHPDVHVFQASLTEVTTRLQGVVKPTRVTSRFDQVCIKHLAEAFFANAVVLVEGDTEKSILEGISARDRHFNLDGITVAPVNSKDSIYLPHAILEALGIPTLSVFDNDSGMRARMVANGKTIEDQDKAEADLRKFNTAITTYYGATPSDSPSGLLTDHLFAVPDTLETVIDNEWSEWESSRADLVSEGLGVDGKNAATYALAAEKCKTAPTGVLEEIVSAARKLT